jgi:tripartite ATP-independent transporter DctM subunit
MTRVSVPEMQRAGYDDGFAAGAVAAGGTLGILIPPSVILVIYALLAEESVPALFAAAFIPGLLLTVFCIAIAKILVHFRPHLAPALHSVLSPLERLRAVVKTWKILAIFFLSIGGIYLGWFSPTEAAAVGAGATLAVAFLTRSLPWRAFVAAIDEAVTTTAMLFFVFLGAVMFARFIALTQLPASLVDLVSALNLPGVLVIVALVGFYIALGCVLETVSMILITVPVFLPLITSLGYDPVWFGILVVVVAEMGLITPPVGMNIFIIRAQMPELPLFALFRGVLPFLGAHIALVALLVAWPAITSWLPSLLL